MSHGLDGETALGVGGLPHLARGLVGPLHGALMLTSAAIGAALLLASDIAARTLLAPQDFPLGVLTTPIGAVFVPFLVRRTP